MKRLLSSFTLLSALVLTSCNSQTDQENELMITGSSTIAPVLSEIAKAYERQYPNSRIEVQSGGSSKGLNDVRQGTSNIGMVSRRLKPSESDVQSYRIALDGLAIIVNQSNPIEEINSLQVIDIYLGKITNWKQLGGMDKEITVVSKAEGRSTLEVFSKYFGISYRDIQAHVIIGDNQQGIQTVNGNTGAIGYVSIGAAEYEETHNNAAIKRLPLDGTAATTENLINQSYPIARDLNLVLKGKPSNLEQQFIDFSKSTDVIKYYHSHSLIPATLPTKISSNTEQSTVH
ncbi:phosphate ABC transporter substrate-binding protein [Pleionea mediterranea]|uniref:Phosphate ABC transporter substrate-binding protein (PhoT family) n=1 Tax=Pleionea mediterranea TaxID=523701 RepID=A0A316FYV3_9GAMM|nr:phosphate ABC transporter substrate-binding protein [Pleionea mediterranea]PWK53884.1 phosphate ABC transporter substrate-binding protein (PhoT family) [Pleionea mediterranea]